jgi:hypothetical protein
MKKIFSLIILSLAVFTGKGQTFTISGYVKDSANGESMIGVSVYKKGTTLGALTNVYGFYSLTLPAGQNTIVISYIGYKSRAIDLDLTANASLDVELAQEGATLNEIVVLSEKEDLNVKSMEMGTVKMDMKQISKIPALLGEVDVIRSIQLLPGVTTVGEGATGFNVRGGNIDQNLILLDEAPVYNSSHLFGFFSVFNPDAVKDVKLIKGGIPAQYGGRLSSLLDIRMKEGNSKKLELNGGIGTIFSRFSIEGPIIKDKMSFIVAGRRSYIDILARPILKNRYPALADAKFFFYDLTAKIHYRVNKKNMVFASGYFGRDVFGAGFGFDWGNATTTLRWNHIFGEKLFLNTTAFYSNYTYKLSFTDESNDQGFDWNSKIINYSVKPDFSYYPNARNTLHFGGQAIFMEFQPGNAEVSSGSTIRNISLAKKYALESALYADEEFKASNRFSIDVGLRYSMFNFMGEGNAYTFYDTVPNTHKRFRDSTSYGMFETIRRYGNFEPRMSLKYELNDESSIKASYNRMAQYIHIVSNTAAATPLDIWTPSTNNIRPQLADQAALGYFRNLKDNMFETSVEIYYKWMQQQLDYVDNAQLLLNKFLEQDLVQGTGRAYGIELFARKTRGKLTGMVSYTLSKTQRKVSGISNDEWYNNKYDRPHNVSVVLSYTFSKRWDVSSNFVFISGTPNTFPDARFELQGYIQGYNTSGLRNNFRNTPYHRLDFSATYNFKKNDKRRWQSSIVFSVYNAYARKNAFAIYFQSNKDNPVETQAIRYSIVGSIIPALTYNFKF